MPESKAMPGVTRTELYDCIEYRGTKNALINAALVGADNFHPEGARNKRGHIRRTKKFTAGDYKMETFRCDGGDYVLTIWHTVAQMKLRKRRENEEQLRALQRIANAFKRPEVARFCMARMDDNFQRFMQRVVRS